MKKGERKRNTESKRITFQGTKTYIYIERKREREIVQRSSDFKIVSRATRNNLENGVGRVFTAINADSIGASISP